MPWRHRITQLSATFLSLILLAAPSVALPNDDAAALLAARAEAILDRWDGDASQLTQARTAIDEAIRLDPASAHYQGVLARAILLAGTTEEGIRSSALGEAHRILFHAWLEMKPMDARAVAYLVPVRIALKQDAIRAVSMAEQAAPNDPWVKLARAHYCASLGDQACQERALEEAIALGLASPIELRKAYDDVLLNAYVGRRDRAKLVAAYEARAQLDPRDPYLRGRMARDMIVSVQDFAAAERYARDALEILDFPEARSTLSLALYGQWAEAKRAHRGLDVVEPLFRKAAAFDPGAHLVHSCMLEWAPLQYVGKYLQEKIDLNEIHKC